MAVFYVFYHFYCYFPHFSSFLFVTVCNRRLTKSLLEPTTGKKKILDFLQLLVNSQKF